MRSPHSVLFDWIGTLGVFGLAWAAVLLGLASRAGRARPVAGGPEPDAAPRGLRAAMRAVAVAGLAVLVWSAVIEAPTLTPGAALTRGAGAVLWVVLAIGLAATGSIAALRAAALALGSVVLTHAMLEVSPVLPGSASWCGAAIGLAASAPAGNEHGTASGNAPGPQSRRGRGWARGALELAGGGGLALVAVVLVARGSVPLWAWSGHMTDSAAAAARLTDPEAASRPDPGAVAAGLERALAIRPGDLPTRSALTGFLLRLAAANPGTPAAEEAVDRAIALAERGAEVRPERVAAWGDLANAKLAARAVLGPDAPRDRRLALGAAAALERAAALDRNAVRPVWRLVELSLSLGDRPAAARWAREAIERHGLLRLDPLVGLSEAQLERARALASGGER